MKVEQKKLWNHKWGKNKRKPVNNFAKRSYSFIKKKKLKSILDIGCGLGTDAVYFAKKNLKVTAVDFSDTAVQKLREYVLKKNIKKIVVLCKDIRKLDFKNNSFDAIYAHLSLHYFDDKTTTKIFGDLYMILKKGGILFIKCKSTDDMHWGRGIKLEKNLYCRNHHIRHFFDKEYMNEKLNKFQIISIRKTASVHNFYKSSYIEAIATK